MPNPGVVSRSIKDPKECMVRPWGTLERPWGTLERPWGTLERPEKALVNI